MNTTAKYAIVSGTGHTARWRTSSRVEKSNASNARYGERDETIPSTITLARAEPRTRLSQIETAAYEPDWNGPRLTAPFVAQVLGQVLAENCSEKPSTRSAYRCETQIFRARLCDRRA